MKSNRNVAGSTATNDGIPRWRDLLEPTPPADATAEPAAVARAILAVASQTKPPTDLSHILGLWPALRVSIETLDGPGYLLDLGHAGGEILLRRQDPPTRRRFTLAHEIGHWILGVQVSQSSGDEVGVRASHHHGALNQRLERWCDRFATELLLPSEWIVMDIDASSMTDLPTKTISLPGRYRTSRAATWARVSELTDVSILLRRWFAASTFGGIYFGDREASGLANLELRRWVEAIENPVRRDTTVITSVGAFRLAYLRPGDRLELIVTARPLTSVNA